MRKAVVLVLLFVMISPVAIAKKKKKVEDCPDGLKKIVAVGQVDAGLFSFEDSDPTALSKLLQSELKKEIEARGCYVGLIHEPPSEPPADAVVTPPEGEMPPSPEGEETEEKTESEAPPPKAMSPAETMRLVQQSQQMLNQMMQMAARGMGGSGTPGRKFSPAPAQALIRGKVATARGGVDTGGAVGMASILFPEAGLADFASESFKVTLNCIQLDPQYGVIVDQKTIKTSSSNISKLGGVNSYYYEDSGDQKKAYDKLFKRGIKKCSEEIDDKLKKKPWEGQIIEVKGDRVFLNAGSGAGVKEGMKFRLIQKEALHKQGVQFGAEETWAGVLEVEEVEEQYAVGKLTVGGPAQVGQTVRVLPAGL